MPDPQLIRVRKYPNRRLYDATRSRHLTHEELYDLVIAGHTVSVTDSRTDEDITNLVLVQAMLERSPGKLAAFPPELSHLLVRASEQMLRSTAHGWFMQFIRTMAPLPPGGLSILQPFGAAFGVGAPAPRSNEGAESSSRSSWSDAPPAPAVPEREEISELRGRIEALMREVESLKARRSSRAGRQTGRSR